MSVYEGEGNEFLLEIERQARELVIQNLKSQKAMLPYSEIDGLVEHRLREFGDWLFKKYAEETNY